MTYLPEPIQRVMMEMEISAIARRREAVLRDPIKHRATFEFPKGARMNGYYFGSIMARGKRIRYLYCPERNLAGYFICWRETWDAKRGEGKRDLIVASKRRATIRNKAKQRYETHKARLKGSRA